MAALENRYARALLLAAVEKNKIEEAARFMSTLASLLSDKQLRSYFFNPRVDKSDKMKIFEKAFPQEDSIFKRFLWIVLSRRRETLLPDICKIFHKLKLEAEGAVEGVLECANEISQNDKEKIERAIAKDLGKNKVILEVKINPELISGVRIYVAGRLYDSSALGKLSEIRERLLNAPI